MSGTGATATGQLLSAAQAQLKKVDIRSTVGKPQAMDSDGTLTLQTATGTHIYEVEVKTKLTANSAPILRGGDRRVLVAPYVSEPAAAILHRNRVQYVDTVGNMYLEAPGLLVDIRGRRQAPTEVKSAALRTFQGSGIRVLFSLLCAPESVAASYRSIAERSTASLGTVQKVLTELTEHGYLYNGQPRRLQRLGDLFDRWVEAYSINLWPKLVLGRFEAVNHNWWMSADLAGSEAQWGGETAARYLDTHLVPETAVIYATELPSRLIIANKLRKAHQDGNVEIRRRFWNFSSQSAEPTVPTPLVYADLLASGDPRQQEAADYLRKNNEALRRLINS